MSYLIVSTNIIKDTRIDGKTGIVIAEHIWSDGQVWPATFECAANEDAMDRLNLMKAQREELRNTVIEE